MAYDPEEAKREAEESKKGGGGGKFSEIEYLEMVEGENRIRILPCVGDRKVPWVKGLVSHRNGVSGKRMIRPKFDDFCPLKKHLDGLYAKGDAISKDRADQSWPKTRIWLWVVPRAPHPQAGKRVLYECDQKTWPDIAGIFADPEYGYIADPQAGRDIKIIYTSKDKTGTGFPGREVRTAASQSALGTPEEIAAWTAKDWFAEYEIGEPMDPGYIQAVIDGKEEEWKAAKKAESDAKKAAAGGTAETPAAPPTTQPSSGATKKAVIPGDINAVTAFYVDGATQQVPAIAAEAWLLAGKDFMVAVNGAWVPAAQAGFRVEEVAPPAPVAPPPPVAAAPPPPAPTPPPAPVAPPAPAAAPSPPPAPVAPPAQPQRKFWISNNGAVEQKTESEVVDFMKAGWDGPIMLEGDAAWGTTAGYGFKAMNQAAPPPPAAPPPVVAPAAPPPSAAPPMPPNAAADAQAALQAQINALKAASMGQGAPNAVIEALK